MSWLIKVSVSEADLAYIYANYEQSLQSGKYSVVKSV